MIYYLLAMSSPTHGVPAEIYYSGGPGQSRRRSIIAEAGPAATDGDHTPTDIHITESNSTWVSVQEARFFHTLFLFRLRSTQLARSIYVFLFENNRNIALINRAY